MFKPALSLVACATLVASLGADSLSLEPVIVTATKTEQSLSNVTANVYVITAEEIVIEGTHSCANVASAAACETRLTLDAWVTPMTPALAELRAFRSRAAELMKYSSESAIRSSSRAMSSSGLRPVTSNTWSAIFLMIEARGS